MTLHLIRGGRYDEDRKAQDIDDSPPTEHLQKGSLISSDASGTTLTKCLAEASILPSGQKPFPGYLVVRLVGYRRPLGFDGVFVAKISNGRFVVSPQNGSGCRVVFHYSREGKVWVAEKIERFPLKLV
ncbi:MAG TPA: hypothetical protein VFQ70_02845 [Candidatus Saccharimonadaceae bacterium]|nr:hypothetical protein [Candidatus Saccharimonadaceae bacterium]